MRELFVKALKEKMIVNNNIFLLTGDLGYGLFNDIEKEVPNQYYNIGVAEQNMINISTGLALTGMKTFCYSIANFSFMRGLEQIRNGPIYHGLDTCIVSSGGGFSYGQLGYTHFAIEDYGILSTFKKLNIYTPGTVFDLEKSLKEIFKNTQTSYLRLEKKPIFNKPIKSYNGYNQYFKGNKIAIISVGCVIEEAIKINNFLKKSVSIYSLYKLQNKILNKLLNIIQHYEKIIVIEEHVKENSVYEKLCAIYDHNKIIGININNGWPKIVGDQNYLRKLYRLDSYSILKIIKKYL